MTRSILYVDGFNFYYGVTDYWRKTEDKLAGLGWCDFRALVERHFIGDDEELVTVKYFSSRVTQTEEVKRHQPGEHKRYGEWDRAVRTIDRLQVIRGFYQKGYQDNPDAPWKSRNEKQNEVNIAVEMMLDGLHPGNSKPEKVYLLSEDSDLMPVIFALEGRLRPRIPVTILLPSQAENNQNWYRRYRETRERLLGCFPGTETQGRSQPGYICPAHILTKEILAQSLLPYTLRDKTSEFRCRTQWQLTSQFLKQYCPREDWRPVPTE